MPEPQKEKKKARRTTKRKSLKSLTMLLMTKHAMLRKKGITVGTSDITMGPSLVTKGRSEPNLTTS
jgi:hypothetical protein